MKASEENAVLRVMPGGHYEDFGGLLHHNFLEFLDEYPPVKEFFYERVDFYKNLGKTKALEALVGLIHKGMEDIQKSIDPEKLAGEEMYFNYWRDSRSDPPDWISERNFWELIPQKEKWVSYGKQLGIHIGDSLNMPWIDFLNQYGIFVRFTKDLVVKGLIEPFGTLDEKVWQVAEQVEKLKDMLEGPMYSKHISDFEWVEHFAKEPKWLQMMGIKRAGKELQCVYEDMMMFLEECETEEKREFSGTVKKGAGRKAVINLRKDGTISYKGQPYKFPKEYFYGKVSQKVYELSQELGWKVSNKDIHESLDAKSKYEYAYHWNALYTASRKANDWAKRQTPKLPKLFQCKREYIERLL